MTHLSGRKYVCEACAEELAKIIGFVPKAELDDSIAYGNSLVEMLSESEKKVEQLEAIPVEYLKSLFKKAVQPAPAVAKPKAS